MLCVSPPPGVCKRFISVERGEGAILDRRQGRGEYCYNALYTHTRAFITHIYNARKRMHRPKRRALWNSCLWDYPYMHIV